MVCRVEVRTAVAVTKGATLFTSYAHTLDPTLLRREHLHLSKFFECDCARCADPTELGTHMSSLKCTKCDNGLILSTNPLGKTPCASAVSLEVQITLVLLCRPRRALEVQRLPVLQRAER